MINFNISKIIYSSIYTKSPSHYSKKEEQRKNRKEKFQFDSTEMSIPHFFHTPSQHFNHLENKKKEKKKKNENNEKIGEKKK